MAITQPGDTTVISALSVPGDAGPAVRAESVQGGFVALTGSGPPDTTRLPLNMRRAGELAYTPTDNKFWQLVGGTADANWVEKVFGKGGLITVATNSDRDALPSSVKTEGMIVFSQRTQSYYALGADLSTWTFIDSHPSLSSQADWYVNASAGSDTNDGKTSGTALATQLEFSNRFSPNGTERSLNQATVLHVAAGAYTGDRLRVHVAGGNTFKAVGATSSGSSITLSSVTNPVPGTTIGGGTRGRIVTASGTFAVGQMLRCTSGSHVGAIAFVQELDGDAQHAFVTHWHTTGAKRGVQVNLAAGDVVVPDTNLASLSEVSVRTTGSNASVRFQNFAGTIAYENWTDSEFGVLFDACTGSFASGVHAYAGFMRCQGGWFTTGGYIEYLGGNHLNANYIYAKTRIDFSGGDCVSLAGLQFYACSVALSLDWTGGSSSNGLEFERCGSNACIIIGADSVFSQGFGLRCWGVTGSTAIGVSFLAGSRAVFGTLPTMAAPTPMQAPGSRNFATYSFFSLPAYGVDCISDSAPASVLASRFGATFYVDPAFTGLPDGTESNPYPSVTAAIAAAGASLTGLIKVAPYTVSAENVSIPAGSLFEIQSEASIDVNPGNISGDITVGAGAVLTLTNLTVSGTLTGATVADRSYVFLTNTDIAGAVSLTSSGAGYWSVNCAGNGTSGTIDNGSFLSTLAVTGEIVGCGYIFGGAVSFTRASKLTGCLMGSGSIGIGGGLLLQDTTFSAAPTFTGAGAVKIDGYSHASALAAGGITLASGATIAILNDVNPSGIQQAGASDNQALIWKDSESAYVPASISTDLVDLDTHVLGGDNLTGALENANDALVFLQGEIDALDSSHVANASSVSGLTVTAALNALLTAIGGGGGVTSVFGRAGAIIAALNDYTTSLIQNLSTVTGGGSTATSALNALQSQISGVVSTVAGLVTGVSSWNTRGGAVVPAAGDYNTTQVNNASSVAGSTGSAALNALLALTSLTFTSVQSITANTTIGSTHANALLNCNNTGPITLTLPVAATHGLPAGTRVGFIRSNGTVSIAHPGTVTLRSQPLLPPVSFDVIWELVYLGGDEWSVGIDSVSTDDLGNASDVAGANLTLALNALLGSDKLTFSSVRNVSTSTYTFVAADAKGFVFGSSGSAQTFTIPSFSLSAVPIGSRIIVYQYGAGPITIAAGAGVTLHSESTVLTTNRYSVFYLDCYSTDEWVLSNAPDYLALPRGVVYLTPAGTVQPDVSFLGKTIALHAAGSWTIELLIASTSGIPVGARFEVIQEAGGALVTSFVFDSGVSPLGEVVLSRALGARYVLTHFDTNIWTVDTILPPSTTRAMPLLTGAPQTYWSFNPGIGLLSTGSGGSGTYRVPLGPFDGAESIAGITVRFKAAGGHGSLPSSGAKPVLRLYSSSTTGSSVAALATATDPSASVPAYEAAHTWSATIAGGPVSTLSTHFWAEFDDEAGASALGGLLIALTANIVN